MTRHNARRLMGAIAFTLAATCALQAQACCRHSADQGQGQTYLERLHPSVGDKSVVSVGEGAHTYRFVVRDARQPDRPWRRARYQVSTREGVKWEGGPDAHQGVTDAQGRTAVYRSKTPVEPQDWMVLPLLGQGPQGMTFRLVDQDDNGVADHPYLIDAEGGAIFCGLSLPGGHTARVLDRKPTTPARTKGSAASSRLRSTLSWPRPIRSVRSRACKVCFAKAGRPRRKSASEASSWMCCWRMGQAARSEPW